MLGMACLVGGYLAKNGAAQKSQVANQIENFMAEKFIRQSIGDLLVKTVVCGVCKYSTGGITEMSKCKDCMLLNRLYRRMNFAL